MFELFETFIAVYETKSFTRAAQHLFISQPTVSVRIQKLEGELQTPLFTRDQNHRVRPTEAATMLYPQALEYLANWEQVQMQIRQRSLAKTPFKIAVSHSAATSVMPEIFKKLQPFLPELNLTINMQNSEKVFQLVADHDIHFGIIEKPIRGDLTQSFPLFSDELVLAGYPKTQTFFIREAGSGVSHYTQQFLKTNPFPIEHIIPMNSNDMIIAHLKAGLGASLISKRFVTDSLPYQYLSDQYQRIFYGLAYLDEHDPLVLKIIDLLKYSYPFQNNAATK